MTSPIAPLESEAPDFLEKLVLAEIEGKNKAVHAYDEMIWKIRTGLLTLLFVGWSVLLKSIMDNPERSPESYRNIVIAMFLFSFGLALGGWFVDHAYVRRRSRVILALNQLMDAVSPPANIKSLAPVLLRVAGDDPSRPHRCMGYWEAVRDGCCVFFVPIVTLGIAGWVILAPSPVMKQRPSAGSSTNSAASTNQGIKVELERQRSLPTSSR